MISLLHTDMHMHTHLVHMCDVWNDISSYRGLCEVVLSVWPGCVNIPQHDLCTFHGNNNLCVLMDRSDTTPARDNRLLLH